MYVYSVINCTTTSILSYIMTAIYGYNFCTRYVRTTIIICECVVKSSLGGRLEQACFKFKLSHFAD